MARLVRAPLRVIMSAIHPAATRCSARFYACIRGRHSALGQSISSDFQVISWPTPISRPHPHTQQDPHRASPAPQSRSGRLPPAPRSPIFGKCPFHRYQVRSLPQTNPDPTLRHLLFRPFVAKPRVCSKYKYRPNMLSPVYERPDLQKKHDLCVPLPESSARAKIMVITKPRRPSLHLSSTLARPNHLVPLNSLAKQTLPQTTSSRPRSSRSSFPSHVDVVYNQPNTPSKVSTRS